MKLHSVLRWAVLLMPLLPATAHSAQTLADAINQVVKNHPQVQRSTAAWQESLKRIEVARAGYLPSLDLTGDVGIETINSASTRARNEENRSLGRSRIALELRQQLYTGERVRNEIARTTHFADARELELKALQENLALEATQAYLQVINRRSKYDQALANLESHERIFEQIRSRVEQGIGTRADLAQINSRLNSANANFLTAENNLRDAETDYLRVIGERPGDRLAPVSLDEALMPDTLDAAEAVVFRQNPTVQASQVDIEEARSLYARSRAAFLPELDLVARANYGDDLDATEGRDSGYSALLEMRWNLFNGGADQAERQASNAIVSQARSINDDASRQALQGLQLSWNAYEVLEQQRAFLENYVRSAEATRDAYLKEYQLGKRTLIDLLDSENEVLRSANEFTDADTDYEAARARVLNALGTLTKAIQ